MVGSETPKIRETSLRSIPRSQAASILSLRSFEYGFMTRVSHTDQPSRKPLSEAAQTGASFTLKSSPVVLIGVGRRGVGRDNGTVADLRAFCNATRGGAVW